MDNDKVQPSVEKNTKTRKSVITMGLQRTLSTEKYQSIVIHQQIQEEIEWETLEERQKKMKNWETIFLSSFKTSHDNILNELNLSHKKAYFKNAAEDKDYRLDQGSQHELEDIETLDTLG